MNDDLSMEAMWYGPTTTQLKRPQDIFPSFYRLAKVVAYLWICSIRQIYTDGARTSSKPSRQACVWSNMPLAWEKGSCLFSKILVWLQIWAQIETSPIPQWKTTFPDHPVYDVVSEDQEGLQFTPESALTMYLQWRLFSITLQGFWGLKDAIIWYSLHGRCSSFCGL